jgi:glucuronyl esterase-like protein/fibronectin type III domain protein
LFVVAADDWEIKHQTETPAMKPHIHCSRCSFVLIVTLLLALVAPGRAASVALQAESGTLGSQITTGTSGTTQYITPTMNGTGTNPGSTARVATYSVTFPAAGTYKLYGRVFVGSGSANDDSFFYANGFGTKTVTADADWILVNSINVGGFTNASNVVSNSGTAGISVWKWISFSDYTGSAGETPISFTVTGGNLTQTFQIGTREDGLWIDAFVFGTSGSVFTVADLDAAAAPPSLPAAPTSLSAVGGNAVVNLTWVQSVSPGITQNKVYRSTTGSSGPYSLRTTLSPTTSFADTSVVNGTQYFYTVTASNANGESGFSAFSGATPNPPPPPPTPTGLAAMPGNGQVSLSWNASSGATSYNVKRSTTSGGPYTTITNRTTTSFINTGLANGTTYYYVVSALNSGGESGNTSQVSATPSGTTTIPLVYSVENTGTGCAAPPMPTLASGTLPTVQPFPDPFMWVSSYMNGSFNSRSTNFTDWECHRNETRAMIENYEIGTKPVVNLQNIFASFSGTTLTVRVTNIVSGQPRTLTLTCAVSLPTGTAARPAVIGMNSPSGSIPASLFTSRNIARITFTHNQVTVYGNPQNSDPFFQLYPTQNVNNTGQYAAWSWGVSRIIDGLYKLNGQLGTARIDLQRIAVTGCSYAGKMALFSGAFDERVALTIAQESGGGGANSWRYNQTEPDGSVEKIDNTDYRWFKDSLHDFAAANVSKLPDDHHMLCAMVAPRALFVSGNPDFTWLGNPSCYVNSRAVQKVYETWGIGDRFGFNIIGGHGHCATTASIDSEVGAFLDKFLLGNTSVNTTIRDYNSAYNSINYARWTQWWGTTNPVLPP